MVLDVLIVQHADKTQLPGDHGITAFGREQVLARGESMRKLAPIDEIWCSNLPRARETAEIIAESLGFSRHDVQEDARNGERINW